MECGTERSAGGASPLHRSDPRPPLAIERRCSPALFAALLACCSWRMRALRMLVGCVDEHSARRPRLASRGPRQAAKRSTPPRPLQRLKSRRNTSATTSRPGRSTASTGRSSRGSARSSAITDATLHRRAPRRAPRIPLGPADRCSSRREHVGEVRGRPRRRHAGPLEPGRRDLRGRELLACVGCSGRLQEGDLRLQPRGMVRGRGRELGGEVPRAIHLIRSVRRGHAGDAVAHGRRRRLRSRERGKPDVDAVHLRRSRGARSGGRASRMDSRRGADDGAGDGRGGERAAGTAVRARRSSRIRWARAKRTARARSTTCSTAAACDRSRKSRRTTRLRRTT